jgi:hypothetical protein
MNRVVCQMSETAWKMKNGRKKKELISCLHGKSSGFNIKKQSIFPSLICNDG